MSDTDRTRQQGRIHRLRTALNRPIDATGLAFWRIAFGGVIAWEAWRFIDPSHGWSLAYSNAVGFQFKYWPFTFVEALSPTATTWLFLAMLAAGVMVLTGTFYRFSSTMAFLLLSYVFLIDKTHYLNHFYLIILLSFLMIFIPADRVWSVDAWRRRATPPPKSAAAAATLFDRALIRLMSARRPKDAGPEGTVPAWSLWLLRFQVGVPYFFGGIAKLNGDWLRAEPLRAWLAARTDFPLIGQLFTNDAAVYVMAYGALLLDLTVVFFLLSRRTRNLAFAAALAFHLMNARLFSIGVFPWTMILGTIVFFDADWPRRLVGDLRSRSVESRARTRAWWVGAVIGAWLGGFLPSSFSPVRSSIGAIGMGVLAYHLAARPAVGAGEAAIDATRGPATPLRAVAFALLALWVGVQVLVPLRHYAVASEVHWSEEGHRWAWHMKLRSKGGSVAFTVTDPLTGETTVVDPLEHLLRDQLDEMSTRPDMIVQFAHHLEALAGTDVIVTVDAVTSLNKRAPQRFIDPAQDLTQVSYPWWPPADWILPLRTPLTGEGPPDDALIDADD